MESLFPSVSINVGMVLEANAWVSMNLPMGGYGNHNTSERLMFGGYVKVKESLYTQVLIWVILF